MLIDELLATGKEKKAFILGGEPTSDGFAKITIKVVYVESESSNQAQWGYYSNFFNEKNQYKGLVITANLSRREKQPYNWKVGIKPISDSIGLDEAKEVSKNLGKIIRRLHKIEDTEGTAKTFDELVIRVARLLKVQAFWSRDENHELRYQNRTTDLRNRVIALIDELNQHIA